MENQALQKTSNFLPQNYQLPDKTKQFMKIEPGDNVIRVLSAPLMGWVYFDKESKPHRRPYNAESKTLGDFTDEELKEGNVKRDENGNIEGSRHFWIMLVWDRKTNTPKILEITQVTIIRSLLNYLNSEDWGDLREFDVNIIRKGTGRFDTEFEVMPKPHKPLSEDVASVVKTLEDERLLDLNAIWKGDYPFQKYLF
ncbi:hypothetical protein PG614_02530 [Riemerella anatipestifer]|nr:hypothetical protein [Riemerella anatipestifer]MDY3532629.1 hypothetical protein [Riemerella anatipestifer]MDY3534817.1 hypothetical protein [Riemerella anatipestifer]